MASDEFAVGTQKFRDLATAAGLAVEVLRTDFDRNACELAFRQDSAKIGPAPKALQYWFRQDFIDDLPGTKEFQKAAGHFLASVAARLVQPEPTEFMTRKGTAIRIEIHWPFRSQAEDRAYWVPALVRAGIPASLDCNVTAAIDYADEHLLGLPSLEPPAVEGFVVNAIRRAVDQSEVEFHEVGSQPGALTRVAIPGKPVKPATPKQTKEFLLKKAFWLAHERGDSETMVNVRDPYDARYLGVSVEDLARAAGELRAEGLISLDATGVLAHSGDALLKRADEFREQLEPRERGSRVAANSQPPASGSLAARTEVDGQDYDTFICHASEDKTEVVLPLADSLRRAGLKVWLDRFCLTLGDSLRAKIDEGLARSRYGIVVLSPNFFGKHWPQRELDGLIAREDAGDKVVLPVWHRVNRNDVASFSPILAGRYAVETTRGLNAVVEEVLKAVSPHSIGGGQGDGHQGQSGAAGGNLGAPGLAGIKLWDRVYISPLVPSGHALDEFQVIAIHNGNRSVVVQKTSSMIQVTLPQSRIDVLANEAGRPKTLTLKDGRVQWLTLEQRWRFFPGAPNTSLGVSKHSGRMDPRASQLSQSHSVTWVPAADANLDHGAPHEIVYDNDGCYFQRPDGSVMALRR